MPITRSQAAALIGRQDMREVFQEAPASSAALSTFRTINMGTSTTRMPLIDALPTGGFVGEGTGATQAGGQKPQAEQVWRSLDIVAEEIAVIVVIPENVFDDTEIGVWDEVRPRIAERFGAVVDAAVFFGQRGLDNLTGTNAGTYPATWPSAIEPGARAAGNVVGAAANTGDLVEDINQTWAAVEADGFDVNVNYAARAMRARLRGLRDANQQPLLSVQGGLGQRPDYMIYGEDLVFVTNGAWTPAVADADAATAGDQPAGADLIAGDRTKAVIGIRQDVTFKPLDQATVHGVELATNDLVGLRAKFRLGFQVIDPSTLDGGAGAYPFAVLGA